MLIYRETDLPPVSGILDNLTPDDVRQLVVSEDELATSQRFTRIFPTQLTHKYFRSVTLTFERISTGFENNGS